MTINSSKNNHHSSNPLENGDVVAIAERMWGNFYHEVMTERKRISNLPSYEQKSSESLLRRKAFEWKKRIIRIVGKEVFERLIIPKKEWQAILAGDLPLPKAVEINNDQVENFETEFSELFSEENLELATKALENALDQLTDELRNFTTASTKINVGMLDQQKIEGALNTVSDSILNKALEISDKLGIETFLMIATTALNQFTVTVNGSMKAEFDYQNLYNDLIERILVNYENLAFNEPNATKVTAEVSEAAIQVVTPGEKTETLPEPSDQIEVEQLKIKLQALEQLISEKSNELEEINGEIRNAETALASINKEIKSTLEKNELCYTVPRRLKEFFEEISDIDLSDPDMMDYAITREVKVSEEELKQYLDSPEAGTVILPEELLERITLLVLYHHEEGLKFRNLGRAKGVFTDLKVLHNLFESLTKSFQDQPLPTQGPLIKDGDAYRIATAIGLQSSQSIVKFRKQAADAQSGDGKYLSIPLLKKLVRAYLVIDPRA